MNVTSEIIKTMFDLIPRRKGWKGPEYTVYGRRKHRGKERYVAGYSHSRIGAHFLSGLVYDRILGYGDTQDAAINMMRQRLKAMREHKAEIEEPALQSESK